VGAVLTEPVDARVRVVAAVRVGVGVDEKKPRPPLASPWKVHLLSWDAFSDEESVLFSSAISVRRAVMRYCSSDICSLR
jgi:hypothetical protein